MKDKQVGRLFVVAQAVLLVSLVVLPGRADWPTPPWLKALGLVLSLLGLVVVGLASRGLGAALTPTPVPTQRGQLTTTGLYAFVRHPIYTGVLSVVVGITLRSGSVFTLATALFVVWFFHKKAQWEEARLRAKHSGYVGYAARTPRFLPRRPRI